MMTLHGSSGATKIILLLFLFSSDLSGQDNKGNPLPHFLFPSFREGLVVMKDGKKFSTLLNYNMVDERMITELKGVYRYSKDPKLIDTIYLENRVFIPVGDAFYEILTGGPVTFLLENKSLCTPAAEDIGIGGKSRSVGPVKQSRFEITKVVYQYQEVAYIDLPPNVEITPASVFWVRKNNKLEKFSNKKQFLKIFPESRSALQEYINKNNIDIRSREDVIKLGNYCNNIAK
jgi:hypothetical protein